MSVFKVSQSVFFAYTATVKCIFNVFFMIVKNVSPFFNPIVSFIYIYIWIYIYICMNVALHGSCLITFKERENCIHIFSISVNTYLSIYFNI